MNFEASETADNSTWAFSSWFKAWLLAANRNEKLARHEREWHWASNRETREEEDFLIFDLVLILGQNVEVETEDEEWVGCWIEIGAAGATDDDGIGSFLFGISDEFCFLFSSTFATAVVVGF